MVKSPIVARINALLAEKGIAKKDFFAACGISSATYSQWNTGVIKNPRNKNMQRAADFLGVSLEYLLTGKDSDEETEKGAEKAPDPKIEGEIIAALPEDIQQLIQICRNNPGIASALIAVARQIEKGQAAQG